MAAFIYLIGTEFIEQVDKDDSGATSTLFRGGSRPTSSDGTEGQRISLWEPISFI
jgi:hypothetical protein